ncbi:hypothetical protein CDAR_500721 [Caerostris darwini]|uniref:Uncharacterized protein n=1 Tax=Caerostris darwini TaxID=1538125 RepID=A0AAV4V227_9ARAC|nr:hypothetical protein CDAR_500721 [Caerostris darwini]
MERGALERENHEKENWTLRSNSTPLDRAETVSRDPICTMDTGSGYQRFENKFFLEKKMLNSTGFATHRLNARLQNSTAVTARGSTRTTHVRKVKYDVETAWNSTPS